MKKKKVLFLSGGGTKIVFLASVALSLIKTRKIEFDHFVGVSAGSLLSIMLAMGRYTEIEDYVMDTKTSDIFVFSPKSLLGRLIAFWNVISGKTYLYNDDALRDKLKKIITKEQFEKYKKDPKTPKCYVLCVDVNTGAELIIDVKEHSYLSAIGYIMASTSIPVFVKHKVVNGRNLYDGGLRSHIGSYSWLKKNIKQINESYSVYSRPRDLEDITWELPKGKMFSFNIAKLLNRVIEIMNLEISKSDEIQADLLCAKYLKRNEKIFAPYKLLENAYANSRQDNLNMWNLGVEAVEENPNLWKSI